MRFSVGLLALGLIKLLPLVIGEEDGKVAPPPPPATDDDTEEDAPAPPPPNRPGTTDAVDAASAEAQAVYDRLASETASVTAGTAASSVEGSREEEAEDQTSEEARELEAVTTTMTTSMTTTAEEAATTTITTTATVEATTTTTTTWTGLLPDLPIFPDEIDDAFIYELQKQEFQSLATSQYQGGQGAWEYGDYKTLPLKYAVLCAEACEEDDECHHWNFNLVTRKCDLKTAKGGLDDSRLDWICGHSSRRLSVETTEADL